MPIKSVNTPGPLRTEPDISYFILCHTHDPFVRQEVGKGCPPLRKICNPADLKLINLSQNKKAPHTWSLFYIYLRSGGDSNPSWPGLLSMVSGKLTMQNWAFFSILTHFLSYFPLSHCTRKNVEIRSLWIQTDYPYFQYKILSAGKTAMYLTK